MGSKGANPAARTPVQNGFRSPDPADVAMKYQTPIPPIESPGGASLRFYDSQRQSRSSMLTPGDKGSNDIPKNRFTGKSTLKNPFG